MLSLSFFSQPEEVVNPKFQGVKKHVPAVVKWKGDGNEVRVTLCNQVYLTASKSKCSKVNMFN